MQRSVSSQPTGRVPTRPRSWLKPPTSTSGSRRKDMLAPTRLRTGSGSLRHARVGAADDPVELGREPARLALDPARPHRRRRRRGRRGRRRRRPGARASRAPAIASSSRKATTSPLASATPVLRAPERPCFSRLATTSTSGQRRARLGQQLGGVVDHEDRSRAAGSVCARSESSASPSTSRRSTVKAQITTEIVGRGGGALGAGLALHRRDSGRPTAPRSCEALRRDES